MVNEWLLSFRSRKNVAFDEKLIPMGHLVETSAFYQPEPVGETFFDHCYLLEPGNGKAAATLENPENGLRLSIFPGLLPIPIFRFIHRRTAKRLPSKILVLRPTVSITAWA